MHLQNLQRPPALVTPARASRQGGGWEGAGQEAPSGRPPPPAGLASPWPWPRRPAGTPRVLAQRPAPRCKGGGGGLGAGRGAGMSVLSDDSTYTFLLTTMLMFLSVMTVGVCYLLQGAPLVRSDKVSGRGAAVPRGRRPQGGLTPGGHPGQAVVPAPNLGRRGAQLRVPLHRRDIPVLGGPLFFFDRVRPQLAVPAMTAMTRHGSAGGTPGTDGEARVH